MVQGLDRCSSSSPNSRRTSRSKAARWASSCGSGMVCPTGASRWGTPDPSRSTGAPRWGSPDPSGRGGPPTRERAARTPSGDRSSIRPSYSWRPTYSRTALVNRSQIARSRWFMSAEPTGPRPDRPVPLLTPFEWLGSVRDSAGPVPRAWGAHGRTVPSSAAPAGGAVGCCWAAGGRLAGDHAVAGRALATGPGAGAVPVCVRGPAPVRARAVGGVADRVDDPAVRGRLEDDRLRLQNDVRIGLLQAVAGVAVIAAIRRSTRPAGG